MTHANREFIFDPVIRRVSFRSTDGAIALEISFKPNDAHGIQLRWDDKGPEMLGVDRVIKKRD
jgi:hypothetical protein